MAGYRVNDDHLSKDARRMREKRKAFGGSLPTEKARNKAVRMLIQKHRREFDRLVREARSTQEDGRQDTT